ncbi:MAG TPA: hypothetical protein PLW65_21670, partial [Pseudomonadota bacterium]|nr:hypothetical protein [Pseudomonadota bacterium]
AVLALAELKAKMGLLPAAATETKALPQSGSKPADKAPDKSPDKAADKAGDKPARPEGSGADAAPGTPATDPAQ